MSLAIQLPSREERKEFNLRAWRDMLADTRLNHLSGKFETDRYGHIIIGPPAGYRQSGQKFEIGYQLRQLMGGKVRTECPLSTSDGVKAVDVVWISDERERIAMEGEILVEAPEICVEVLSPSNTQAEMDEKTSLYFDAGAVEVWLCGKDGAMHFHGPTGKLQHSVICPAFPYSISI